MVSKLQLAVVAEGEVDSEVNGASVVVPVVASEEDIVVASAGDSVAVSEGKSVVVREGDTVEASEGDTAVVSEGGSVEASEGDIVAMSAADAVDSEVGTVEASAVDPTGSGEAAKESTVDVDEDEVSRVEFIFYFPLLTTLYRRLP